MTIRRGDIFIASEKGALTRKPRPVLVVQASTAAAAHPTVTICLISKKRTGADMYRLAVMPTPTNGLDEPSEIQADHIFSLARSSFDRQVGVLSAAEMQRVDMALRRWLSL